ncbi:MAG TPA: tRNA preQ1(34) S-adenosylmethionine ribosyltransferase-isomerase QueA [Anaerolineae bacterium]|nr:tRNA preQ1(34) S-adenosylmethionine ribosyltransferase-isomerase QueA [Anaerolineae bacterium]
MNLSDFDYTLPQKLIAQTPIEPRDASRLMVINRSAGTIKHKRFSDLPDYLRPGDILALNDSRVIPARLFAAKESGGKMELLLLKELEDETWEVLVGGKRIRKGTKFTVTGSDLSGEITQELSGARRIARFNGSLWDTLYDVGHTPLPPYIHEPLADSERYQTIYSRPEGSAAAPTAGLHFTPDLLISLRDRGVLLEYVTLHVGLDTFKPVEVDDITQHPIHSEWATISSGAARRINDAKLAGGRIVAVGTTSVRTLETGALRSAGVEGSLRNASQLQAGICPWRPVQAFEEEVDLYIYPGFHFRAVDVMLTNFHLPKSSLLMMVSAYAGQDLIKRAYQEAIEQEYRFYSFGDAMLIL